MRLFQAIAGFGPAREIEGRLCATYLSSATDFRSSRLFFGIVNVPSERSRTADQDSAEWPPGRADSGERLTTGAYRPDASLSSRGSQWIGRELDNRYRILGLLGEGGMGAVFLAQHLALQKPVAIKVVRAELVGNGEVMIRLAREAMATAQLEHPHVVSAIDCATLPEGGAYFVMQLVQGISLCNLLAKQPHMPWPRVCEIGAQIADALSAAEEAGVIHRDLKPDNILIEERLDGSDMVKVLDFGIAHVVPREALAPRSVETYRTSSTHVGTVMGTPGYMAPEQAIGASVDHRCDLYALGVILWESIAGQPLWDGPDVAAMILRQMCEDPPRLSHVAADPSRPPELDRLVERLLERMVTARPEHAAQVRDALRRIADQYLSPDTDADSPPLAAQPERRSQRSAGQASHRRGRWPWLLALGTSVIAYGTAYQWHVVTDARERVDQVSTPVPAEQPQPRSQPRLLAAMPVPAEPPKQAPPSETVTVHPLAAEAVAEHSAVQQLRPQPRARPRGRASATKRDSDVSSYAKQQVSLERLAPASDRAAAREVDSSTGKRALQIVAPEPHQAASDSADSDAARGIGPPTFTAQAVQTERKLELEARVQALTVRGSLATSVIRRAVQRIEPRMFACYDSRAAAHHRSGDLDVEVEFDERGYAHNPRVRGGAWPALNDCVAQAAGTIALSRAPDTGVVRASWKVTFASR